MRNLALALLCLLCSISAYAYQFILEGTAAGKYPIVMEVDRLANGAIEGRYAYKSTLKSKGRNNPNAWLYIQPNGNASNYLITDNDGFVQERWTSASFTRENGVNHFYVSVTNAKGNSFAIVANSSSKNTSSWVGTYSIHSDGYRMSPPPINATLTLTSTGSNSYKGTWKMALEDGDDLGVLTGNVTATVANGVMTIKLVSSQTPGYDNFFAQNTSDYPRMTNGIIAKISKSGTKYKLQPVGTMKSYLSEGGGPFIVVKTK